MHDKQHEKMKNALEKVSESAFLFWFFTSLFTLIVASSRPKILGIDIIEEVVENVCFLRAIDEIDRNKRDQFSAQKYLQICDI